LVLMRRLGRGLLLLHPLTIQRGKVDRIDQQRRETALAHKIRHEPARKGEQQGRTFDKQEGTNRLFREILEPERAAINEFQCIDAFLFDLRIRFQRQQDFVNFISDGFGLNVEVQLQARLLVPRAKAGGRSGFSNDRSLIYCPRTLMCGIFGLWSPGVAAPLASSDIVLILKYRKGRAGSGLSR
jgi:hypothetical protein